MIHQKVKQLLDIVGEMGNAESRAVIELLQSKLPENFQGTIKTIVDAPEDWKQEAFCAAWLFHKGHIHKACKEVGVSYATYAKWKDDPSFQAKLRFAQESQIAELRQVAYDKAAQGDNEMLKFMLSALDPKQFDSQYRKQQLQNESQNDMMDKMTRHLTQDDIREIMQNDPIVDYTDPEYFKH